MELYQKIRFMNLRKLFYLIKITQNHPNVTIHQPNVTLGLKWGKLMKTT